MFDQQKNARASAWAFILLFKANHPTLKIKPRRSRSFGAYIPLGIVFKIAF